MRFEQKAGKYTIILDAQTIGSDILVTIFGGDEYHIGGISVAYPTKSHYRDATTISLNSITLPGHKDYILSNEIAEKIAGALEKVVTVVVGIHMEHATKDDIEMAVKTSHHLVDEFLYKHTSE